MRGEHNTMERRRFLMRFVFRDTNNFISDAEYLVDVPAEISIDKAKREIARCHNELHREAKYVESLEFVDETELTEEYKKLVAEAEENNLYLFAPETPDALLRCVCRQNESWAFSRAKSSFDLRDGTWVH